MKARLRRSEPQDRRDTFALGDVLLDRESHDVTVDGKPVELTAKEFELLAYFMAHAGMLVSRDCCSTASGARVPGGTRTSTCTSRSSGASSDGRILIRTLRGAGYKAVAP